MAARTRRIVVGYDGSDAAQRALDAAAGLAGYGSTLSVVAVSRRGDGEGRVLDGARERLVSRNVAAAYLAPVGDPAEQLIETAREVDADLLVVGRRDENAIKRLVLGSVSSKVVSDAPCDVLVVRGAVSLSPVSLQTSHGIERLVLPSPNGSTICALLAESGVRVVAACLRNARAVGEWLRPQVEGGAVVAVVPAGERWPDRTLRPAAEDFWGAGALLDPLDGDGLSPEARLARDAYAGFAKRPLEHLTTCASGLELIAKGFADDVALAGRLNTRVTSYPS